MTTESEIYTALSEIFSDIFNRDDIILAPELTAADVEGWDSFRQIEIIIACEERFGVKFRTKDLDTLSSLGRLVNLIVEKTG